jgi:hypothetical protein
MSSLEIYLHINTRIECTTRLFGSIFVGFVERSLLIISRVRFIVNRVGVSFFDHHHHKHPGLGHLARSVSRVTVALSIVSLVSQLFSFFFCVLNM